MNSSPILDTARHAASVPAEQLADASTNIAKQLFRNPEQQVDRLGEVYLACEAAAREQQEESVEALRDGGLAQFLLGPVREALGQERSERVQGGWLGTFIAGDGRAIESDTPDTTDRDALDVCGRALSRAEARARADGNDTLLRNLSWYRMRLAHRSYDAIAREENRVAATVRTGVARARKFVLRVVDELQTEQPAPLSGEASPEIEPLRKLWLDQKLDQLAEELERTRESHALDPHWLNLAGLLAADRGRASDAIHLYEQGLVHADAPSVRGRLLNNLGNLIDDQGRLESAEIFWLRAHQLVPRAPAPLLNLVSAASQREDYASAQHRLALLGDLLGSGVLADGERQYVFRRLEENPQLAWLRDTDAWRVGPARWLRGKNRAPKPGPSVTRVVVQAASAALLALTLLLPGAAGATVVEASLDTSPSISSEAMLSGLTLLARETKGGDSMGKPPRRGQRPALGQLLLAGDSMGRSGSPRPGKRRPGS